MTGKTLKYGVALLVVAAAGAVAVQAADSPDTIAKRKLQRKAAQYRQTQQAQNEVNREWVRGRVIDGSVPGANMTFSNTPIIGEASPVPSGYRMTGAQGVPAPSPGLDIGFTSYDYQANSSQAHNVARTPTGQEIHFTWMAFKSIPTDIEASDRYVLYTAYDKTTLTSVQGYNGAEVTGAVNRAGYCNIDASNSNLAHVGMHQRETGELDPYEPWHVAFPFPPTATADLIALEGYDATCAEVLWPRIATDRSNEVIHEIAHSNVNDCPDEKLWYWRFNTGTLAWDGPGLVSNTPEISYALAVDANSDKVAVVVHAVVNSKFNVGYIESANNGTSFLGSVAPIAPTIITNYSAATNVGAWVHLTATYDNSTPGALHIVWDEQEDGTEHITLRHWNSTRNTIRPIAQGYWDSPVSTSIFNLNLAKPSMGIGDGSTMCQGGAQSNNNYVYVTYTQFGGNTSLELEDYSDPASVTGRTGGYMNGEIYLAVSNSGGNTWSPPVNLTNTKTPACNPGLANLVGGEPQFPDNVCRSEHWATIGRVVRDIDVFFISDIDAGGIPQGEGSWQLNPVHYLRLAGATTDAQYVCPVIAPVFASTLSEDADCEYNSPQTGQAQATLTVSNFGNATLSGNLSVTDFPGAPTLTVPGTGAYSILAGDPDVVKTVTMAANGAAEGLYTGSITLTHNDLNPNNPSPKVYSVEYFVFNEFYCPEDEILKTGVASPGSLALQVETNGRFGSQVEEGQLWRHSDSSSSIFDASLLIAHGTQGPTDTVVFHRFFNRPSNGQNGFRAQSEMDVDTSAYGTGSGYACATASMSTRDSVVGIDVEWVFPQDPSLDEIVLVKYTVRRHDPAVAVNNLAIGILADLDAIPASYLGGLQSGATNSPGSDGTKNLIWVTGTDSANHVVTPANNTATRFRGGVAVSDAAAWDAPVGGFVGALVGNNVADIQPGGGPTDGFLYQNLLNLSGIDLYSVADTDLYALIAVDNGISLGSADTREYVMVWASDTISEASFKAKIDAGLALVATSFPGCSSCNCPNWADPNADGIRSDVLDVSSVVNVAFRGAASNTDPGCLTQRQDVNNSGAVDVLDVSATVNVAFRGGNAASGGGNFVNPCAP